jgi:hypothetical protein
MSYNRPGSFSVVQPVYGNLRNSRLTIRIILVHFCFCIFFKNPV